MGTNMNHRTATASYVGALTLYGTIGWVLFYIDLPSEIVVLCRGFIGTLFISAVIALARGRFDRHAVRANLVLLALSGILLGLNWVLLFAAYRATTVAIASLCNYMAPIILIVAAPLLLHEKRSIKKLACAACALFGMTLVSGLVENGPEGVNALGIALALGAALCFAAMVICNKKMGALPVYEKAAVQLAFATIAALPFVLANNWGVELHPDALSIALVAMLGIVHTGVAYCLYFGAFDTLSAQTIAVLGYIEPGLSVIISALVLHQPLSLLGWIGAVLVIGSAAVSEVIE